MQFNNKSCRPGVATLSVTVFGAAAITFTAAFPTVAQGAVVAVTTVSCSVTGSNWCISGNNGSSGIGVIGTSKSGTGLRGTSTSQYGLKATSGSNVAIYAQTTSGSSAISALGSSNGNGVNASAGGVGISGTSTGSADSGIGVLGYSKSGTGGYFLSGSNSGVQVYNDGHAAGLYVKNSGGDAAELIGTSYGVVSSASGYPLVLENDHGIVVFQVDSSGNVQYKGTLQSLARTAGGGTAHSFSPNSTQPTVEDTGTAQLVRGAAVVRLEPTFAASIEPTAYRVFVTPNGETNGLFVAGKSAAGFVVRESDAGRSTVTFDYRIVATALGAAGQHMAMLSPAVVQALAPRVPRPALTKPARLATPATQPATP